ncbi:MAG: hypothetical protein ACXWW7_16885 [Nocardioides sp.]
MTTRREALSALCALPIRDAYKVATRIVVGFVGAAGPFWIMSAS